MTDARRYGVPTTYCLECRRIVRFDPEEIRVVEVIRELQHAFGVVPRAVGARVVADLACGHSKGIVVPTWRVAA
jgi:hypothetical protein